nr:hypothetical protein [Tanacetum cinerariifolium]
IVAKLEKDVSDLKKIDLSAKALTALKTQVPFVIDNYLGSKFQDTPTVDLEQGSKKSALEILKIKREQAEKQQKPKFTIKSTDKATLKEYDLKSTLYQSMHANNSFNKNPTNHQLYHALMEVLIEDENAMDKGIADTVKDHKRKHDDDEDNDDKDPPARPNQDKAPYKGSKTGKSIPTKETVEEPIAKVVMDYAGVDVVHDEDQPQDASKTKTKKAPNQVWFKQPLRPPTLDPEWNTRHVVFDQPEQPWFNQMVFATKDPLTFNDLMANPIDFSKYVLNGLKIENLTLDILLGPAFNLLKGTCSSSIELEYNFQEYFNVLKNKLNWNNPKGPQIYKFKECDFVDLHLNDIEDMLLLAVQHKLFHLNESDIVDFYGPSYVHKKPNPQETCQRFTAWCRELLEETEHHIPQKTFPEIKFT